MLGNRGHSRLWGELLGHTADRVNEHAPCSVLIVRSKKEAARYRKMLIGFDGSSASERALRSGLALAKQIGSEVDVLWIDEAPVTRGTQSEMHDDERRARDFFNTSCARRSIRRRRNKVWRSMPDFVVATLHGFLWAKPSPVDFVSSWLDTVVILAFGADCWVALRTG